MTNNRDLMDISTLFEDPPIDLAQNVIEEIYDALVDADNEEWNNLEDARHIQLTGILYNFSEDLQQVDGLERVIKLNERIADRDLHEVHQAIRHYQLANAYSLRDSWSAEETAYTFFDSNDLLEAIGHARASVAEEYRSELGATRETQSYVNFANHLSRTGRVCEALVWYNKAIQNKPNHAMGLGNRGQCKLHYAGLLFSENHTVRYLHSAYNDFEKAIENWNNSHPYAKSRFEVLKKSVEDYAHEGLDIENEEEFELGESEIDEAYHEWVLENRLYLNPLNDIYTHSSTAYDPFHLPDMLIPDDEDFPYPGIYNQIKQEYVSARYLYYEGKVLLKNSPHFSDRDVKLPDTLDYSVYGYRTEQIKTALRMAYSIFDKIAVLINEYFGVNQCKPNFSGVWHKNGDYKQGLAEPFQDSDNWALNALYWLKKDFYHGVSKNDEESVVVVAHELKSLRNAVEHDYIKVFDDRKISRPPEKELLPDSIYDAIGKSELRKSTFEMLRYARAAMIYIALAIHHEERKTKQEIDGPTVPLGGTVMVPDKYKE